MLLYSACQVTVVALLAAAGSGPSEPWRPPDDGLALTTVVPSFPGHNDVRWWQFDWRITDIRPEAEAAPIRLYFYEAEQEVVRHAVPEIVDAYRDLVQRFAFRPTSAISLYLYNSHFEFESPNTAFVSESVLGVTRKQDLSVSLPYWGEMGRFRRVLRHELAHQFALQKMHDAGEATGCNPHSRTPLWFIEGVAEFAALPALQAAARAALVGSFEGGGGPRLSDTLPSFFHEGPKSFARIYLLGHAQVRFLEERFGAGTIDRLLVESAALCELGPPLLLRRTDTALARLVSRVTGLSEEAVDREWRAWARAQASPGLRAKSPLATLEVVDAERPGQVDSFALSPDGQQVLFRLFDAESATSRLYLRHLPSGKTVEVAEDHQLGLVTLHALDRRVMALGDDLLVYIGRVAATDRIFARRYRWTGTSFELEPKLSHDVADYPGLIEAGFPAIDAKSGAVAFVGLSRESGNADVFRLPRPLEADSPIERLTADAYAEQGLAFAADYLWLASDATPDAHFELARLVNGHVELVTSLPRGANATNAAPAGQGVVFESDASGLEQAYLYEGGGVRRISDVAAGLSSPAVDMLHGALFGIVPIDGQRRLVRLPRDQWIDEPVQMTGSPSATPWVPRAATLKDVGFYRPLSLENWRLASAIGAVGTGPTAFANVQLADRFGVHVLGVKGNYSRSLEQGYGELSYQNRVGRLARGLRLFFDSGEQQSGAVEYTRQRFGGDALVTYPFNQYIRLEGSAGVIGLRLTDIEQASSDFAARERKTHAAVEADAALSYDTLRLAGAGPFKGTTFWLRAYGAIPLAHLTSFGSLQGDIEHYLQLRSGYERFFLRGRLAAGASARNLLSEQFYLPAAYNLQGFNDGSRQLIGSDYALGVLEVSFPLAPRFRDTIFLQGVLGGDAGSIAFRAQDLWDERTAAAVGGVYVVFMPFIVRGMLALPVDIGAGRPVHHVVFHLTVAAPLLGFY
jgi:hypothetical protein